MAAWPEVVGCVPTGLAGWVVDDVVGSGASGSLVGWAASGAANSRVPNASSPAFSFALHQQHKIIPCQ